MPIPHNSAVIMVIIVLWRIETFSPISYHWANITDPPPPYPKEIVSKIERVHPWVRLRLLPNIQLIGQIILRHFADKYVHKVKIIATTDTTGVAEPPTFPQNCNTVHFTRITKILTSDKGNTCGQSCVWQLNVTRSKAQYSHIFIHVHICWYYIYIKTWYLGTREVFIIQLYELSHISNLLWESHRVQKAVLYKTIIEI